MTSDYRKANILLKFYDTICLSDKHKHKHNHKMANSNVEWPTEDGGAESRRRRKHEDEAVNHESEDDSIVDADDKTGANSTNAKSNPALTKKAQIAQ